MREQIASVDSIGDVVIFDIDRLRAIEKDESSEAPGRFVKDRVSVNLPEELLLAGTRLRLRSVTCHRGNNCNSDHYVNYVQQQH